MFIGASTLKSRSFKIHSSMSMTARPEVQNNIGTRTGMECSLESSNALHRTQPLMAAIRRDLHRVDHSIASSDAATRVVRLGVKEPRREVESGLASATMRPMRPTSAPRSTSAARCARVKPEKLPMVPTRYPCRRAGRACCPERVVVARRLVGRRSRSPLCCPRRP